MNKNMLKRVIETMMTKVVSRPVRVEFAQLGKDRDHTVVIQKSLFEFGPEEGPKGPMYITFNNGLLQDTGLITQALQNIIDGVE
jgi:hypothetical protein